MSVALSHRPAPGSRIAEPVQGSGADEPRSSIVKEGPIRWHVTTMGRGPAALLLHGTGASSHSFHALMHRLARHYTVVVPDLPGHARTEVPSSFESSMPNVARVLGHLIGRLGLRPQLLVGHSAGAALAARMVLDGIAEPDHLVGLAPALVPFPWGVRSVLPRLAGMLSRSIAPSLIAAGVSDHRRVDRLLRSTGSTLDTPGIESYRRLVERPDHVHGVLSMMAQWDPAPLFEALPRLYAPFLLLAGEKDRAVPLTQLRDAKARLPRARLVVVEGAGHLLHEEFPRRVSDLVLEHAEQPQSPHHEDS